MTGPPALLAGLKTIGLRRFLRAKARKCRTLCDWSRSSAAHPLLVHADQTPHLAEVTGEPIAGDTVRYTGASTELAQHRVAQRLEGPAVRPPNPRQIGLHGVDQGACQ